MKKGIGYLRLMRPANIVTAVTDVLAGITISGYFILSSANASFIPVLFLCLSTMGLYGGGVVFNDVFDHRLDWSERPERPIPSGIISVAEASVAGTILLLTGIVSAFFVNSFSGCFAIVIAIAALTYNKWSKHLIILGPVNMGLCRGLNLLLGTSVLPEITQNLWPVAFIPLLYIAAITMISRGEVYGSTRSPLYTAGFLYLLVIGLMLAFAVNHHAFLFALFFLVPFGWMIFSPLLRAIKEPTGSHIGKAVKAGVIGLILMNASWAASCGMLNIALLIFALLPLSYGLSKMFAVT